MTVTVLHSFIQKVCLKRQQLGLQECMFYKVIGSAAAKSGYSGRFYSTLGRRYLLSNTPKQILQEGWLSPTKRASAAKNIQYYRL